MLYYGCAWVYTNCLPFIDIGHCAVEKSVKLLTCAQYAAGNYQGPVSNE